MQILHDTGIILFENVFSSLDFNKILEYLNRDRWYFGHGSHSPNDRDFKKYSTPFWGMNLENEKYFTEYLLNIIQTKTKQNFFLDTVYANGHLYGTQGSFHQDSSDLYSRTFLYYANKEWDVNWGGKTIFDLGGGEYFYYLPKPNSALYFPGFIEHTAENTTRLFTGLRTTIAWKMFLK